MKKFIKWVSLNASVLLLLRVYTTVTVIFITGTVAYTLNSKDKKRSLRDTQSIFSESPTRLFDLTETVGTPLIVNKSADVNRVNYRTMNSWLPRSTN